MAAIFFSVSRCCREKGNSGAANGGKDFTTEGGENAGKGGESVGFKNGTQKSPGNAGAFRVRFRVVVFGQGFVTSAA